MLSPRFVNNYLDWDTEKPSVTTLLLDPKNPRVPPADVEWGQRELMAELVKHDHVYDLARDIITDGWSPLEMLIGHEEDGKTYVLEGNRRLCALKLLKNPDLAPSGWEKKFKAIATLPGASALPMKLPVLMAPTREDAAPLIMQKHTRPQIEEWDPLMKARFYRSLANAGLTPDQLAKQYGGRAAEFADMLRLEQMYSVACKLELPKPVAEIVRNPRAFKATNLERILGFAAARELLGVVYDEDGQVSGKGASETFVKAYTQIVTDIATGEADSRSLHSAELAEQYVKKIVATVPGAKKGGTFRMSDVLTKKDQATRTSPKKVSRVKPAKPPATIIPKNFRCDVVDPRIAEVLGEIRTLRMEDYPNTCAVMLRVLLELAVDRFLHKTGKLRELTEKIRAKNNKPKDWTPTLEQMLGGLVADDTFRLHGQALRVLNKMISSGNPLVSDLNGFVHNNYVTPTSRVLISHWEVLEPIFGVVLSNSAATAPVARPRKGVSQ